MKHARDDYNRIQDPAGLIPADEPVFLLRAQDKHFIAMLMYYKQLVYAARGDGKIIDAVDKHLAAAKAWPVKKAPDMPDSSPVRPSDEPLSKD